MKKFLGAFLGFVALSSGSAMAADMALPYKAPPPPPPTWTGCYVSAGWGYGMLDDERYVTNAVGTLTEPDSTSAGKGWLGAFGGGCDYQFNASPIGPIVVGAFADYDPMDIRGSFGDPVNNSQTGTQTMQDAWYAGARAGVLITPTLLTYIDGGYTGADIGQISLFHLNGTPVDGGLSLPSEDLSGWFIGGGTEYAFTWLPIKGLFWKTEYRFAEYDDYSQNYIHSGTPFVGRGTHNVVDNSVDVQTITTSLVWRFNWTGH